jgi:hypothetical protein
VQRFPNGAPDGIEAIVTGLSDNDTLRDITTITYRLLPQP